MWASEAKNPLALTGNLLTMGKRANVNAQLCISFSANPEFNRFDGFNRRHGLLCLQNGCAPIASKETITWTSSRI